MKLLVTGGAGFIGSHYVRSVLGNAWGGVRPESVVVLDKLTYAGNKANLMSVADDERLQFVEGDILDYELVDKFMGRSSPAVGLKLSRCNRTHHSRPKPLRVIAGVGLVSAFLGFGLGVFYVLNRIFGDVQIQGWTTIMVSALMGGGLILLSLGIIAEYLGMRAARSMGRSTYLVVRDPRLAFPGMIEDN